jgi:pseudaminic acid biosynthesis-associated methylase
MKTEEFWSGSFGNEYLARNQVNWQDRVPFWQSVVEYCTPANALEVGCNRAHNLAAIQSVDSSIELYGVDVNAAAVEEARQQGFEAKCTSAVSIAGLFDPGSIDLVFTAGVLIHVAPEDLEATMRAIIATSSKYVLAVEYEADETEEVEYRGHTGKLWKRPYGKLYRALGLKLLVEVPNADGFDACTAWLFEKAAS